MFAARLPAVLLGGLTAWGVFRLAELTTGSRRAGHVRGAAPAGDTDLRDRRRDHHDRHAAGLLLDLGGGLGAIARSGRTTCEPGSAGVIGALGRPGEVLGAGVAGLGRTVPAAQPDASPSIAPAGLLGHDGAVRRARLTPIVVWNAQHGWAGAGQLADRVGLSDRATWGGIWPVLSFLGGEAAVLGGIWWIVGIAAMVVALAHASCRPAATRSHRRPRTDREPGSRRTLYLLCLWGVVWCACLAASVLGETEANWMAPGYVSLVVLIGRRIGEHLRRRRGRARVPMARPGVSRSPR